MKAYSADKGTIPDEWGPTVSSVLLIWDKMSGTLLHIDTPDDHDCNSDEIEIRMSLLSWSVFPRERGDRLASISKQLRPYRPNILILMYSSAIDPSPEVNV